MKKIGIIGVLLISLFFPNLVKADTTEDNEVYLANREVIENIYNDLMTEYQNIDYPYYSIYFSYDELGQDNEVQDNSQSHITGFLYYFTENNNYSSDIGRIYVSYRCRPDCTYIQDEELKGSQNYGAFNSSILELQDTFRNYAGNLILQNAQTPDYYINSVENQYIEVNLNNYKYVILNLKNYNQDNAFTTNLQVKGEIGITPIYNYGQTTKDAVTGVKVQDRCNVEYQNYTSYPFYILKQDLQNNVVYAVKSCKENSSFKYNGSIFDITYVTSENEEDPIITIDGKQYHTIPFDDLPSTANKNEEENYIPGESGSANSEGGLSGALKGIQQKMSEIWDIITFFTGFVNTMFSILPEPIRIILLSAFAIAITLGLIKIFIN